MAFPYPLLPTSFSAGFAETIDYAVGEPFNSVDGALYAVNLRAQPQRQYKFEYYPRTAAEIAAIIDLLHDSRFGAQPVLIRNWRDYQATSEVFAVVSATQAGTTTAIPLIKTYGSADPIERTIKYPEDDDLAVTEDGVPKTIASSSASGVVPSSPWGAEGSILRWTGTFYDAVRLLPSKQGVRIIGRGADIMSMPQLAAIEDLGA